MNHEWTLNWRRSTVPREAPAVEQGVVADIAAIGVIGGGQLSRIFGLRADDKKRLERKGKLIRHDLQKNRHTIPIYTAACSQSYWLRYDVANVIQCMLFFNLYQIFPQADILPAPSPFTGMLRVRGKLFYVYVVRGGIDDLLRYLKHVRFTDRLLLVTETLVHLKPLDAFAPSLNVRVATDDDLKQGAGFYHFSDGHWIKETNHG